MIRINQIKIQNDDTRKYSENFFYEELKKKACSILRIRPEDIYDIGIVRHSLDARKKPKLFDIFSIDVKIKKGSEDKIIKECKDKNVLKVQEKEYDFWSNVTGAEGKPQNIGYDKRIVVIGSGPAGLFCGYMLALNGYRPLIIERGAEVDKRSKIVEEFWRGKELDPNSNVQFGEGGAGTFSDGKLNTVVKDKSLRGKMALDIFVNNGAPPNIRYEAKPHIGTDILKDVVKNIRNKIISMGGRCIFECCVTDIKVEDGRIIGVKTNSGDYDCDMAVLAIGHSARDTFSMLKDRGVFMMPKPFAVGFRVEHPQKLINLSQYGIANPRTLAASSYKLTSTVNSGRGVYSFCMCPGGYVVNASSESGMLAVNGMSYSGRDGTNANSAIIITVTPKDYGDGDVLSGVEFQRSLEKKAYDLTKGRIPVEYYGDFKKAVLKKSEDEKEDSCISREEFVPQMKGDYEFSAVHSILPDELNIDFVEGMEAFGKMIKGYNDDNAIVSGVESRTSSPVRIMRDDNGESENIKGLFPCGEGAGYAGGIMSAAMDGIRTAEMVAKRAILND